MPQKCQERVNLILTALSAFSEDVKQIFTKKTIKKRPKIGTATLRNQFVVIFRDIVFGTCTVRSWDIGKTNQFSL